MIKTEFIRTWIKQKVAYIELDRPEKANSYNQELLSELENVFHSIELNEEIFLIVFTGSGDRSFCAGADLNEMAGEDFTAALNLKSAALFLKIASCSKVTLAAINGAAVAGGLELSLACDVRICSDNASFFFPETKLGLIPAAGGTQRLPQLVGVTRAKEMILFGDKWSASDALSYGLVSSVVQADQLLSEAQQWGVKLSERNLLAVTLAKRAIDSKEFNHSGYTIEAVTEALLYQLNNKKGK